MAVADTSTLQRLEDTANNVNTAATFVQPLSDKFIATKIIKGAKTVKKVHKGVWETIKSWFTGGGEVAETTATVTDGTLAGADGAAGAANMAGAAAKDAKALSLMGTAGEVAGKVATPLMVVAGAAEAGIAAQKGDGKGVARSIGSTAGGLGGMWAAGAIVGAIAGTFAMPIIGTVILGIAGAIAGSMIGSKVTESVAGDWITDKLKKSKAEEHKHTKQQDRLQAIIDMRADEPDGPATNFARRAQLQRQLAANREKSLG